MLDRMFQNTSKGQFQPPVVAIKLVWPCTRVVANSYTVQHSNGLIQYIGLYTILHETIAHAVAHTTILTLWVPKNNNTNKKYNNHIQQGASKVYKCMCVHVQHRSMKSSCSVFTIVVLFREIKIAFLYHFRYVP